MIGTIQQAQKNNVSKTVNKGNSIKDYIKMYENQIAKALPDVLTPERFSRMVLTAITKTPKLGECTPQSFIGSDVLTPERFSRMVLTAITKTPKLGECTPQSFIGSMLTAAQLGLEPNTPLGQAYLIPYGNSCQFQIGYKGLLELAHRSGEIKTLEARCVYENDEFNIEYGLNPNLIHKPTFVNRGELIGVYAVYHTVNGGYAFEFMSVEDINFL